MNNTEQITIFYLPSNLRPKSYPPLERDIGKWWHTGIIYKDKIYECLRFRRHNISDIKDRKLDLDKLGAIYYSHYIFNVKENIYKNINKGYSCDNFVEAVIGYPLNRQPTVINHFEN